MKLLDSAKAEVAVLNEGTTKIAYWGKDPVIIYFTSKVDHEQVSDRTMTVTKIEALEGYIKTDAGNEVKIEGTLEEKIAILENLLGTKIGYVEYDPNGTGIPAVHSGTVKTYAEMDKSDSATITITVTYDDEQDPLVLTFPRSLNAVTVKDVIKKVPEMEGYSVVGLVPSDEELTEENALKLTDKLLEDQELTVLYGQFLQIPVYRGQGDSDEEVTNVSVSYSATVKDAIDAALEDDVVKGWITNAPEKYTYDGIYNKDGTIIGVKAKGKSASTIAEDGLKLTWIVAPDPEIQITGDEEVFVGESIVLTANAENVTWDTSDATIATVENGTVTGASAGEVTITASANGYTNGVKVITVLAVQEDNPSEPAGE